MSVLSPEETDLLTWLTSSIPRWFWMADTSKSQQETWAATVKAMIVAQRQLEDWNAATFILSATGSWLDAHARDRGTFRQLNESDAGLASRLRTYDDAVTVPAVLAAVQAVLTAEGIATAAGLVELRASKGYFLRVATRVGLGATLTAVGTTMTLDTGTVGAVIGNEVGQPLVVSGNSISGNNGTFTITGIGWTGTTDTITYVNASGATGGGSTSYRVNGAGQNHRVAFMGRGYRMSHSPPSSFVVMLPYPPVSGTLAGILEAMRKKKAGGFGALVEQRVNP